MQVLLRRGRADWASLTRHQARSPPGAVLGQQRMPARTAGSAAFWALEMSMPACPGWMLSAAAWAITLGYAPDLASGYVCKHLFPKRLFYCLHGWLQSFAKCKPPNASVLAWNPQVA